MEEVKAGTLREGIYRSILAFKSSHVKFGKCFKETGMTFESEGFSLGKRGKIQFLYVNAK